MRRLPSTGTTRIAIAAVGALLAFPLGTSAAQGECVVAGRSVTLGKVKVRPAGLRAFDVAIRDRPVRARLAPGRGAAAELEVGGAIAFTATANNLWLTLAQPLETDQLRVVPGAHLVEAHRRGSTISGALVMYAQDVLEGEDRPADETVGPVRVACTALTLDWSGESLADPQAPGDGTWWKPKRSGARFALRARPEVGAAVLRVATRGCEDCLVFERIEERDGWLRVARTGEGVVATGWVRRADVEPLPDGSGMGRTYGCFHDHGGGMGVGFDPARAAPAYEGPARLKVGTVILAERGRGAWATVQAEDGFTVRQVRGEPWVAVTAIPGLEAIALPAYVPADAVELPAGAAP